MFVFDAYGTLLDVDAAAREAASEPGMEALKENWLPVLLKDFNERRRIGDNKAVKLIQKQSISLVKSIEGVLT